MGVGAGLYMYVVVVQKFTFAISSPDEFLYKRSPKNQLVQAFLMRKSVTSFADKCFQEFLDVTVLCDNGERMMHSG